MARGVELIVSAKPQGKFDEGIILGTPVPGTAMEINPAVNLTSGRFSYRAITRATGSKGQVQLLLPDYLQGKKAVTVNPALIPTQKNVWTPGDAYVSGTRGFLYSPIAGEEFNLPCVVTGTGTSGLILAPGNLLEVVVTTGLWMLNSAGASAPFEVLENVYDVSGGIAMVWCRYLGNQA